MAMLSPTKIFLFVVYVGVVYCIKHINKLAPPTLTGRENEAIPYLRSELSSCTSAQQSILQFLRTQRVEIGSDAVNGLKQAKVRDGDVNRITVCTPENSVECRVALGPAPVESKCVAPCGCTGSQKWVQFSELNRLRRKDPMQWNTCRTCQQRFEYDLFTNYGGLKANLIGYLLDNRVIMRSTLGLICIALLSAAKFPLLVSRVLTSQSMWQQFPQWSKLTKLPLPLKLWAAKVVGQDLAARFARWERDVLVHRLADLETSIVEEGLPSSGYNVKVEGEFPESI